MVTEKVPCRTEVSELEQGLGGGRRQKLCLKSHISGSLYQRTLGDPGATCLPFLDLSVPTVDNWDSSALTWGKGGRSQLSMEKPFPAADMWQCHGCSELPVLGAVKAEAKRDPLRMAGIGQQIFSWNFLSGLQLLKIGSSKSEKSFLDLISALPALPFLLSFLSGSL